MSAAVVLGVINLAASIVILGVLMLRRVDAPRVSPPASPIVPSDPRISRGQESLAAPPPYNGARSVHALQGGPRFHISALDEHGRVMPDADWRGDSEAEQKERWTRLNESSDVGTFTLYDKRCPGHRGRFSRGVE